MQQRVMEASRWLSQHPCKQLCSLRKTRSSPRQTEGSRPHLLPIGAGVGETHSLPPVASLLRRMPLHLVVSNLAACSQVQTDDEAVWCLLQPLWIDAQL